MAGLTQVKPLIGQRALLRLLSCGMLKRHYTSRSATMSDSFTGGFGQFVPGFEFLRSLGGDAPGTARASLPNLGAWVAPTYNVDELDKRIEELKAVQFWLDQNAKALAATIQALQVQKMTLSTLKSMNLNLGDVAQAATQAWSSMSAAAAPAAPARTKSKFAGLEVPSREPEPAQPEAPAARSTAARKAGRRSSRGAKETAQAGVVDPMQWWGALSQQFQQIANQALQDATQAAGTAKPQKRQRAASPRAQGPASRKA